MGPVVTVSGHELDVTITRNAPIGVTVDRSLRGPMGPMGPMGPVGDLNYTHAQGPAASEWLITHSLGKYPSVTVIDSAGSQVEGEIEYIDTNNLRLIFSAAFTGNAYLN